MKCSNAERNRKWEGRVDMLEKHVAVCEFALVPCPKKCKDDGGKVKCFIKKHMTMYGKTAATVTTHANTVEKRALTP